MLSLLFQANIGRAICIAPTATKVYRENKKNKRGKVYSKNFKYIKFQIKAKGNKKKESKMQKNNLLDNCIHFLF